MYQAKPVTLGAMYVGFKTFCWTFVGSMLIGELREWPSNLRFCCGPTRMPQGVAFKANMPFMCRRGSRFCVITGFQDAHAAL